MPRSGTTLVERIIDAHPTAHGGGELDAMSIIADGLAGEIGSTLAWPDCARDLDASEVARLGARYLDALRGLAPDAQRVTDKQLGNDQAMGLAQLLVPGARLIACERDPIDTCFSCFAQPLAPTLHPYASDFESLAAMYRLVERIMAHWMDTLDMPRMTVRYEDLIDDQEAQSRRIIEFTGLGWHDDCLEYHTKGKAAHTLSYDQVRRPIYRSSIGRAERFGAHVAPLVEALKPSA